MADVTRPGVSQVPQPQPQPPSGASVRMSRGTTGTTTLRLAFTPPYASAPILAALAAHAIPWLEAAGGVSGTHTRIVSAPNGPVIVRIAFRDDHVEAVADTTDGQNMAWLEPTLRRWLDLDTDPAVMAGALGEDPLIGPLIRARPGLRILGSIDGFEAAVLTVLGQQVSVAAGRTFGGRLVAAYGTAAQHGFRLFPTPSRVAEIEPDDLQKTIGLTNARCRSVLALAQAFADGLRLDRNHAEARSQLLALPGIGPWTVEYLAVRVLGDVDAYPSGDLVLQRALGVSSARQAHAAAQAWRPYRAYALFHLWSETAYG